MITVSIIGTFLGGLLRNSRLNSDNQEDQTVKHPDNMTRKEKLQAIAAIRRVQGEADALKFWLTHGARISRKAFENAR